MKKQGEFNSKIATFVLASTIIQTVALGAGLADKNVPNAIYYGDKTIQIRSQKIIDALGATNKIHVLPQAQSMPNRYANTNNNLASVASYIDKSVTGNATKKVITVDTVRKDNSIITRYAGPVKPVFIGPVYVDKRPDPIIAKYAGPIPPMAPEVGLAEPGIVRYAGPIPSVTPEVGIIDAPMLRYAGPIQPSSPEGGTIDVPLLRYAGPIPSVTPEVGVIDAPMLRYAGPIPSVTPEVGIIDAPMLRYAGPIQPLAPGVRIMEPDLVRYAGPIQLHQRMF